MPGALLSAVTPIVTKLRLTSLAETGTVVGRLSGVGTVGAIFGTVLTGFVLISRLSVSGILIGLGMLLVVGAALVEWRTRGWSGTPALTLVVVAGGLATTVAPGGCDAETKYHCAGSSRTPTAPAGARSFWTALRHSYVDLDDPTFLEFAYVRAIASVVDAAFPEGEPLVAHHLGGGGLTFPRYLAATRPGHAQPRVRDRHRGRTHQPRATRSGTGPVSTYASRTAGSVCGGWTPAVVTSSSATPSGGSACRGTSPRWRR